MKSECPEQFLRALIPALHDRVQLPDTKRSLRVPHHGARGLGGVTEADESGEQRETQVRGREEIALHQAAHSDRQPARLQLYDVHPVAESLVRRLDGVADVALGFGP